MQEEMRKNTLGSLVENEKKGTIYAKITKSHPYNTIHGASCIIKNVNVEN